MDAYATPSETHPPELELAGYYVPSLYFHPDEIYLPQPVGAIMGISRMRQSRHEWFDITHTGITHISNRYTRLST